MKSDKNLFEKDAIFYVRIFHRKNNWKLEILEKQFKILTTL